MMKLKIFIILILIAFGAYAAKTIYNTRQENRQAAIDECHGMYLKILNMYASPEVKGRLWQAVDAVCEDL